ncbi:hypothetical protein ANO11243_074730 [Dothideomycetidae sp. 11243]|nr:hypothetical protein ANO11243_074730 [fungal sp. No.11243]
MADRQNDASERTPLIPKHPPPTLPADAAESVAPEGPHAAAPWSANGTIKGQSGNLYEGAVAGRDEDAEDQLTGSAPDEDPAASVGNPEVRKRLPYIMPAIAIGVFLSMAQQTFIVSSYSTIGSDLNALSRTSWIATAYFLTSTSFMPLYGKLSDIFGRKSCLLIAYLIFGAGCLACGLSQTIEQLIAARALAGVGGSGMVTVVTILFSDIVTLRERGKWQGYINIISSTGAAAGAPLGGLLADSVGWRWAFLGQAPLTLVAFAAVGIMLHETKKDDQHWKQKLRRVDFLGAAFLISAVFAVLLALDRGSNVSWRSTVTLVSLGISIPLFVILGYVETKVAKEPFAPSRIIFNRSMFATFMTNFFSFAGWLAAIYYIPLYFQTAHGMSATRAGVTLVPPVLFSVVGSLSGGIYMQKTGRFHRLTIACYAGLPLGMVLILLFSGAVMHNVVGVTIGMCLSGLSNGAGMTSLLVGLIANASKQDQAVATACSYLFRSLGSVFGVSMAATVVNQVLRQTLAKRLAGSGNAEEIATGVRQSLQYLKTLDPATRAIVIDCYTDSTRAAFCLQICLVTCAAVSAWFIKEKSLGK